MSARSGMLPKYSTVMAGTGSVNSIVNLASTSAYLYQNRAQLDTAAQKTATAIAMGASIIGAIAQIHHTIGIVNCNALNEHRGE